MNATLDLDTFTTHVNETFVLYPEADSRVEAELTEVKELGIWDGEKRTSLPFSLLFRCDQDVSFEQVTCAIEPEQMGSFSLFLVPIGPGDDGMLYEAIFN